MPLPRTVTLDQLPNVIGMIVQGALDELSKAGKIEAGVHLGDVLAGTQRRRTGRAQASTTVVGRRPIGFDPGPSPGDALNFWPRASRTELMQSAESTIPRDPPASNAHVIQAAGSEPEDAAYPGFLEPRFRAGERSIAKTEAAETQIRIVADKRAIRALKARGLA